MILVLGLMSACVPAAFNDPVMAEAQAGLDAAHETYARSSVLLDVANAMLEQRIDEIIERQDGSRLHLGRELRNFLLGGPLPLLIWLPLCIGFLLLLRLALWIGETQLTSGIRVLEARNQRLDQRLAQKREATRVRWSPPVSMPPKPAVTSVDLPPPRITHPAQTSGMKPPWIKRPPTPPPDSLPEM
jgi:hypothetical protein